MGNYKKFYDKCSENSRSQIVFRTDIFQKLSLGAPTECMFPNTPEVSQIIVAFSMLRVEACLANLEFP